MSKWTAVIPQLVFGQDSLTIWLRQPRVFVKTYKGAISKLINFPTIAFHYTPRSYTSAAKQIEWQAKRLSGILLPKCLDLKWSYMEHCIRVCFVWLAMAKGLCESNLSIKSDFSVCSVLLNLNINISCGWRVSAGSASLIMCYKIIVSPTLK